MEKWDLYNAKREKSGITMCRGEIIPKGLYHLSVSVWIVNQQGQYLLSQRHPKKQYPLYWECTGGSVFSGETSLQGAIREVKEELGILLTPGSEKLIYQTRRENVQDFYDVWLFHRDIKIEEMRLQETEVVDVQWVSSDKLDRYSCDSFTFSSHGYDLHIDNELVAEAFASLPKDEQSILILRFVLDLTDEEIGRLMGMSRSAVQRHRTSTLKDLRVKLMAFMPEGG